MSESSEKYLAQIPEAKGCVSKCFVVSNHKAKAKMLHYQRTVFSVDT